MFRHPSIERVAVTVNTGDSMAKQSFKAECDVNNIMGKYRKTGLINFVQARSAEYMDCPEIDFQEAMNIVKQAEDMFMDMPSDLRKRFGNDPGQFLAFCQNEENLDEMVKLGLADAGSAPQPDPSPDTNNSPSLEKGTPEAS
jgi:phage internal scaffolding protein